MENLSIGEYFYTTILDQRREKDNGSYPVKYRITYQRKQIYYSSGINLYVPEWYYLYNRELWDLLEEKEKKTIRATKDLKELGNLIHTGFRQVEQHMKDLFNDGNLSLETLKARMKGGTKKTILSAFDLKIETLRNNDRIGTATYYQCAKNCISGFISQDIRLSAVTTDWLRRFEKHMLATGEKGEKGKSYTTVGMYMIALRTIMNEAKGRGDITVTQYPFGKGKYQIQTGFRRNMALKVAQIGQIMNHSLANDTDKMYRDLWFFSYLCNGINFNDLLRLKKTDIKNGEISFYRQKTIHAKIKKAKIEVAIVPAMQAIMDRWPGFGEYIFEGLEEAATATEQRRLVQNITRKVNDRMGRIGEALGIGAISTYTARHSFATVLKRSGVSIEYISESLGHTELKTTTNYLDSFEKGERAKNAAHLTNFKQDEDE